VQYIVLVMENRFELIRYAESNRIDSHRRIEVIIIFDSVQSAVRYRLSVNTDSKLGLR